MCKRVHEKSKFRLKLLNYYLRIITICVKNDKTTTDNTYYKRISNTMNAERLDIVQLIQNNPIKKLSNEYQTRLLERIKDTFNDSDQQLFIASF